MKKIILAVIFTSLFFSCNKDKSSNNNSFQGLWEGEYTGADINGPFTIDIDANGKISGSFTSYVPLSFEVFQLIGTVTSTGIIKLTFSAGTFSGKLTGNTGSGTWENKMIFPNLPDSSGTWSGHKV